MKNLKKNLREKIESNPEKTLLFFDEARFGTHSKLGYGWFEKGQRPQVPIRLGFENFYVYSAIDVGSGQDFSLILPEVNIKTMNEFLKSLSEDLGEREAILVMDRAGWHTSKKLHSFKNIEIIYLPPYSPELNPVEKFWQYIKSKTIRNKMYITLQELEARLIDFFQQLDPLAILQTCSLKHCLN